MAESSKGHSPACQCLDCRGRELRKYFKSEFEPNHAHDCQCSDCAYGCARCFAKDAIQAQANERLEENRKLRAELDLAKHEIAMYQKLCLVLAELK